MFKKNSARIAAIAIAAAGVIAVPAAAQAADMSLESVTPEQGFAYCDKSAGYSSLSYTCYGWGSAAMWIKCDRGWGNQWNRYYTYNKNVAVPGYASGSLRCDRNHRLVNWG